MDFAHIVLSLGGTSGFAALVAIAVAKIIGPRPKMIATWKDPPTIRIVDHCTADVASFARVAATELRILGLKTMVGRVTMRPFHERGAIVIGNRIGWAHPDTASECDLHVAVGTTTIESAVILIPHGVTYVVVLHALLIAMGFATVRAPGHVLARGTKQLGMSRDGITTAAKRALAHTVHS